MNTDKTSISTQRNYQIDALKLLLALFVFISHTDPFIGDNTRFIDLPLLYGLGGISVQIFFCISGFLMIRSASKKSFDISNAGKTALEMTVSKFKALAAQYWSALLIAVVVYIFIYINKSNPAFTGENILRIIINVIPEFFCVQVSGKPLEQNVPTWYISAMLLVMPVLYYLYIRFKDFFLYIFAPLTALYFWGHFCQADGILSHKGWNGYCLDAIPRAFCGLCFGVCAWLIYEKIAKMPNSKLNRVLFTILETFLYGGFFYVWLLVDWQYENLFAMLLLVPFMIAITFSQRSYISELFKFKWMRFFAPLSLTIYFNHLSARRIVHRFHMPLNYKEGVLLTILYTIALCLLSWLIVKVCKKIYQKIKSKNEIETQI